MKNLPKFPQELGHLHLEENETSATTVLNSEDEEYLKKLICAVRSGKRAVFIVEDDENKLKYMFSNTSRAEAITMMGKVTEATGRKMSEGGK